MVFPFKLDFIVDAIRNVESREQTGLQAFRVGPTLTGASSMSRNLSFNTRKSLCNQLGEAAGNEVADLLQQLVRRVELLERTKVDVTPIVPALGDRQGVPAKSQTSGNV